MVLWRCCCAGGLVEFSHCLSKQTCDCMSRVWYGEWMEGQRFDWGGNYFVTGPKNCLWPQKVSLNAVQLIIFVSSQWDKQSISLWCSDSSKHCDPKCFLMSLLRWAMNFGQLNPSANCMQNTCTLCLILLAKSPIQIHHKRQSLNCL